ncbi:ATP-binding protein [Candidatus Woesearchaeota archaeon]|nr:ATP-binding protein [Candidatus Woesearchaeota archaeon]
MRFYDREREIRVLKRILKDFRIAIVGRRRVGKTRLVEHVFKDTVTFFVPAEKSEKEIIASWNEEYPSLNLPRVESFREFFSFVFTYLKDKVVFIDEIQNFLKVNKSFLYDLQRLIDKHRPRLVVTGSLISVMKKMIQDEKQPLYGRFDYIIKLRELDFKTVYQICKDFNISFEDSIKLYSIFGGIPKYYETIEKLESFELKSFVKDMFVFYPRPLYEEVRVILKEEFGGEYKTFFSILSAIARGRNKQGEIASFLGRKEHHITKYLNLLKQEFEVIERVTPVVGGKRGVYKISSNIFEFWFDNVWRYNYFIEQGNEEMLSKIIDRKLDLYVSRKFEDLILTLFKNNVFKFNYSRVGKQWGKIKGKPKGENVYEIDIVALNEDTKEILFGECKWQANVNAKRIVKELVEKSQFVQWFNNERKESFAVFAKSFKKRLKSFEGRPVYCFDLKDLERVFKLGKRKV